MGNFEKLVVLTVLFLAAIILGMSMHQEGERRSDSPLGDAGVGTLTSNVEAPGPVTGDPKVTPVQPEADPGPDPGPEPELGEQPAPSPKPIEASAPVQRGPRMILVNPEDPELVRPYRDADMWFYTLRKGDKLYALAERFYGDRKYRQLLLQANEGMTLEAGLDLMVPIHDLLAEAEGHVAREAAPAHDAPVEVPTKTTKSRTYSVADGDNLWNIAADAYGKGSRWDEIFQANRHQLENEHDLKVGMELIIP